MTLFSIVPGSNTSSIACNYLLMFRSSLNKTIFIVLALTLMFVPITAGNLWCAEAINSSHTIIFIFISYNLFFLLSNRWPNLAGYTVYLITMVLGLLLGVLVEGLQYFSGREMSWQDLTKDFYGLMAGLGLVAFKTSINKHSFNLKLIFPLSIFVLFLFYGLNSLLQLSGHYYQRSKAFPVIVDFDGSWSSSFLHFNRAEFLSDKPGELAEAGKLYRIHFMPGQYPGFSVVETEADWTKYQALSFYVVSQYPEDIEIILRVHDKTHNQNYKDRYNKRLRIHQGINQIDISLLDIEKAAVDRELDLSNIMGVKLFVMNLQNELELDISRIKLQ